MPGGPPRFGPPPQLEDVEAYFHWALATHEDLSKRGVARDLDLARETVRRIMAGQDSRYSNVTTILRHVQEHVEGARVGPQAPVGRIATSPIVTASPDQPAREVAELMATRALTLLPLADAEDPTTPHDLTGLVGRDQLVEGLDRADREDPTVRDLLKDAALREVRAVDHRTPCEEVGAMLEEGPGLIVVTRLGRLEGVVTPDNLWRVTPDA